MLANGCHFKTNKQMSKTKQKRKQSARRQLKLVNIEFHCGQLLDFQLISVCPVHIFAAFCCLIRSNSCLVTIAAHT